MPGLIQNIVAQKYYVLHSVEDTEGSCLSTFIKVKNSIDPVGSERYGSLEEALDKIPGNSNLLIVLSREDLLTRVSMDKDSSLFPEIDEEDFISRTYKTKKGLTVASVCRRDVVLSLKDEAEKRRLFLLDVIFLPPALCSLEGILKDSVIHSGMLEYTFSSEKITGITDSHFPEHSDPNYRLDDRQISKDVLFSLAAVLHFLHRKNCREDIFKTAGSESRFYRSIRLTGMIALASVFLMLLLNFLLFDASGKKLETLRFENQDKIELVRQVDALKIQLDEYASLTGEGRSRKTIPYSYLLDRFGVLLPSGLYLNTLVVHPTMDEQHIKELRVNNMSVLLSGEVKNPSVLSTYIKALRSESWIRDVILQEYSTLSGEQNAGFQMELLLW